MKAFSVLLLALLLVGQLPDAIHANLLQAESNAAARVGIPAVQRQTPFRSASAQPLSGQAARSAEQRAYISGDITNALSTVAAPSCLDFNGNHEVDTADIQAVANHWRQRSTDSSWDPRFDLDGNSAINIVDIMRVSAAWPSPCPPPDPAGVAPDLDRSVATNLAAATAFLYSSTDPIQTGVLPATIAPTRVAVVRGKVITREGQPLPGATITILDHPEFGQTLSRVDGMFDMVVNGGGELTVNYTKVGYLPTQRQIKTQWQEYAALDDVALVPLDSNVTTIDLTANVPMQVAQSSISSDVDGTRRATILFPQGAQAEMVLPGGATQPLTTLNVRATEYTVGTRGPAAMPGSLPPQSGYTYAVEFSVDEALAAGATEVRFNRPIVNYVDNFLGFPVGTPVPAGYYDRNQGIWVPSVDGRIVQILSVTSGMADLDTNGDAAADDIATLAALDINDAERQQITRLYQPGQSVWRVPITHFTPWDYNWPFTCTDSDNNGALDCVHPNQPNPERNQPIPEPDCHQGSIIECQNQTLGESIAIADTPFSLQYRSDRVPGRTFGRMLRFSLSGDSLPPTLKRIDLEIEVAGRRQRAEFPATPNLSYTFTWDGKDAYGRAVQGPQQATIRINYVYPAVYVSPTAFARSFGEISAAGASISPNRTRLEINRTQTHNITVNVWDAREQGLGGWTLDVHHTYAPEGHLIYLGNGWQRRAEDINQIITTVAGGGGCNPSGCGDGGQATQAQLNQPYAVTVAPDGSLYIVDSGNHRIRHVGLDGIIRTVAGNGTRGYSGDNGPAIQAQLNFPLDVALGRDGSLYIADSYNNRVRRVRPDGRITTIVGNDSGGYSGDGGPATAALLNFPRGIDLGADGSLYIADWDNHRIRRVAPDGIITTVAGIGVAGYSGDGGPATEARLRQPADVTVGSDGSLYIADTQGGFTQERLRRVGPNGIITTIAGPGCCNNSAYYDTSAGDGGAATAARMNDVRMAIIGTDGAVITVQGGCASHVRRIGGDGIIATVAGDYHTGHVFVSECAAGHGGDNGPPTKARLNSPNNIALGPDGSLYIADTGNHRIRRVSPSLPGFSASDIIIPSDDGSELYAFDPSGRHLRTVNALTGATRYRFTYDSGGRLSTMIDGDGNTTSIERDSTGRPTAIVSPYGQRTGLTLNADGYLSHVVNPAGDTVQLAYDVSGLLTTLTDPRNLDHHFSYDALGRLIRDRNPAGGEINLSRMDSPNNFVVRELSAMERRTTYQVEQLPTNDERRVNTFPDGMQMTTYINTNGTRTTTLPDGMTTTLAQGPDPRWLMQAPVPTSLTTSTPGGLAATVTVARSVNLADSGDLLSLTNQTDSVSINGRIYTSAYTAANRTFTNTTPEGRQATVATDGQGRPLQAQVAGIEPARYTYDVLGRLATIVQGSGASTRTTMFSYNSSGRLETITDPIGRIVRFTYDAAGRVTLQTLPDGREIGYAYDANGNVTAITPPGRPAHGFAYTPADLQASYTPPDIGIGSTQTQYSYNPEKQLTRVTRPDGQTADLGYDSAGRLSTLRTARGTTTYGYQPATGNLATIAAPGGVNMFYAFDGALPTSETWAGPIAGSVGWTYDNSFRVTSTRVNGGNTISFQYDRDSLLTQAGALALARNPQNGLLAGSTLGDLADAWSYNAFGEPASYRAAYAGMDMYDVLYARDDLGRIAERIETMGGVSTTYGYAYDQAGRLTEVRKDGATIATYTYDSNGNRLNYTGTGGTISGSYDAQDRLTQYGATAYAYTANGELLSKTAAGQTTTYQYDALGNLITAGLPNGTQIGYLVDGRNRRIGKQINGALVQGFLYENQLNPIAELDGAGNIVSRFVYASRTIVPDYMIKDGATYRIIADHLGSPRLVTDTATGVIAQRMDYDEFGNVTLDTAPGFQPFGFAGGLYDRDTQLTRFGARDYNAETGRWTAKDPIGFAGRDANLYGYVVNDPLNLLDPLGLAWYDHFDWLDPISDFSAGFGDTISFGLSEYIRERMNIDYVVDKCSGAYIIGELAGLLQVGLGLGPEGWLLGRGGAGLLNSNRFLRLGWGWKESWNTRLIRIAIGSKKLPFHYHFP